MPLDRDDGRNAHRERHSTIMPGMIQAVEGSCTQGGGGAPLSITAPLRSFSELSFASIRSAVAAAEEAEDAVQAEEAEVEKQRWVRELRSEERGLCLIQLLLACANAVSSGNMEHTNACLEKISALASLRGDPMQRLATYFMEALAARVTRAWPGLHKALNSTSLPALSDTAAARQVLYNHFPYLKFAYGAVNAAILEAMDGERVVHVVDLDGSQPAQWAALLQRLSQLPGGPPHLKITAVNERRDVLQATAARLTEQAEALDIAFQFNQVVLPRLDALTRDMLPVKTGEAVAVSAVLRLHTLLGLRAAVAGKRQRSAQTAVVERFLRMLRGLAPKVVAVAEVESSHNSGALLERFVEALYYYSAVFDSVEATLGGLHHAAAAEERLALEKHVFGPQIQNIVACEGCERTHRHETYEAWVGRFERAGFRRCPMAASAWLPSATALLRSFPCESYTLSHDKLLQRLTLCWGDRPLFTVSAWHSA